jgi:predicted acylesterase/phospholipase RssA
MPKKITLVLPGGGIKGSFQVGFLIELLKSNKYEITTIYGSSFGALLAPIVANKRIDLLINLFNMIDSFDEIATSWPWYYFPRIFNGIHNIFCRKGYYKDLNLASIVWDNLSKQEQLHASKICKISAWNVTQKRQDWFGGNDNVIDFYNGIKASMSLWLLVPPFIYKNNIYTDGGSCLFYPIDHLLNKKINQEIFFVDSCTREIKVLNKEPTNALSLMYHLHDSCIDTIGKFQIEKLKNLYKKNLVIVRPDEDIFDNSLEYDKNKILINIALGKKKFNELY